MDSVSYLSIECNVFLSSISRVRCLSLEGAVDRSALSVERVRCLSAESFGTCALRVWVHASMRAWYRTCAWWQPAGLHALEHWACTLPMGNYRENNEKKVNDLKTGKQKTKKQGLRTASTAHVGSLVTHASHTHGCPHLVHASHCIAGHHATHACTCAAWYQLLGFSAPISGSNRCARGLLVSGVTGAAAC